MFKFLDELIRSETTPVTLKKLLEPIHGPAASLWRHISTVAVHLNPSAGFRQRHITARSSPGQGAPPVSRSSEFSS